MRIPTAPVAAGSLIAGYVIAAETGQRELGGLALLAGTAWCADRWRRRRGTGVAVTLVGVQLACFGASHVLAKSIGAWPSVLSVAAVTAVAATVLADRRGSALAVR